MLNEQVDDNVARTGLKKNGHGDAVCLIELSYSKKTQFGSGCYHAVFYLVERLWSLCDRKRKSERNSKRLVPYGVTTRLRNVELVL